MVGNNPESIKILPKHKQILMGECLAMYMKSNPEREANPPTQCEMLGRVILFYRDAIVIGVDKRTEADYDFAD